MVFIRNRKQMTKWDDTSWQKEFLEMKSHSLADIKLLTEGAKGLKGLK